ncbi:MAG TPA: hypothetical protein VJ488_00470, partial [Dehalococcoidia bacterium]|nr:hypothetical protein [Dehalococcoidia bacterium]
KSTTIAGPCTAQVRSEAWKRIVRSHPQSSEAIPVKNRANWTAKGRLIFRRGPALPVSMR